MEVHIVAEQQFTLLLEPADINLEVTSRCPHDTKSTSGVTKTFSVIGFGKKCDIYISYVFFHVSILSFVLSGNFYSLGLLITLGCGNFVEFRRSTKEVTLGYFYSKAPTKN